MILAQKELRGAVKKGAIVFDPPLEEDQWGEASVDLRLGFQFTRLKKVEGIKISVAQGLKGVADAGFWDTRELKADDGFQNRPAFQLKPGEFVLALTLESVTVPRNMIALIEGRSTYARIGLSMHQTAPWIQPGWEGPIVLEIMNHGPMTVELTPEIDRPCQLTFLQLTSELPRAVAYGGKARDDFQKQTHPLKHGKTGKRR